MGWGESSKESVWGYRFWCLPINLGGVATLADRQQQHADGFTGPLWMVVQEYENGKAVPNQAVLAKMERVLGVKLRGKIHK